MHDASENNNVHVHSEMIAYQKNEATKQVEYIMEDTQMSWQQKVYVYLPFLNHTPTPE
ncbi:hypothetical protein, partial [Cronobacter sakazakii]|uniref:hypothetical protein n=1 Tax=Cronobacter sakazakii TaxID=28141 RepID=UPI003B0009D1